MIHNGTYTLVHAAGRHTVRIKTQAEDARFAPGERVISLLSGSDNEQDYRGFGFVTHSGVRVWNSKSDSPVFRRLAWLIQVGAPLIEGDEDRARFTDHGREYEILLSRRCLRCNRKLTTPESITTGLGPICAQAA